MGSKVSGGDRYGSKQIIVKVKQIMLTLYFRRDLDKSKASLSWILATFKSENRSSESTL